MGVPFLRKICSTFTFIGCLNEPKNVEVVKPPRQFPEYLSRVLKINL